MPSGYKPTVVSAKIPAWLKQMLRDEARRRGVAMKEVVLEALAEALERCRGSRRVIETRRIRVYL